MYMPAYRGSGAATQIHDELERRARERGFERTRTNG
jgi:GNAT superfamily N-acetyltransferase